MWGEETLLKYLENLRKYLPGTNIVLTGVKKAE
jgi:cytochrome c2